MVTNGTLGIIERYRGYRGYRGYRENIIRNYRVGTEGTERYRGYKGYRENIIRNYRAPHTG
jgi:hypothetical protein